MSYRRSYKQDTYNVNKDMKWLSSKNNYIIQTKNWINPKFDSLIGYI